MRANLQFNLPEEEYIFECANKSFTVVSYLEDLQQALRSYIKHGHDFKNPDDALRFVYDEISAILSNITVAG